MKTLLTLGAFLALTGAAHADEPSTEINYTVPVGSASFRKDFATAVAKRLHRNVSATGRAARTLNYRTAACSHDYLKGFLATFPDTALDILRGHGFVAVSCEGGVDRDTWTASIIDF